MVFDTLTTNRLTLTKLTPDTLGYVYANYSDNKLLQFLGFESEERLAAEKEKFRKGTVTHNRTFLYFLISETGTAKVIGWCGFHTWYTDHARAELGYGLYDDIYKNKGYMTEALGSVIRYGFETMGLHRIEAFVGTANIASLKLLENNRFIKEGLLREHYRKDGKMEDSIVCSLLRSEY